MNFGNISAVYQHPVRELASATTPAEQHTHADGPGTWRLHVKGAYLRSVARLEKSRVVGSQLDGRNLTGNYLGPLTHGQSNAR
ncbi:hypothetical protein IM725_05955 [Ramlibacter aquaticus]|uniref:Uncharacterized protein n=1 Tax=Ramlibacter aquaticus TaxID=2780094 RepID=A0ABR9SEE3_9BURK|nr:hypothetical protein [Ramlibacter aquaticus]MBE7940112.1 hypothetical protein [Ramlibacter aquaticus]